MGGGGEGVDEGRGGGEGVDEGGQGVGCNNPV
jgi:hypothetical protein